MKCKCGNDMSVELSSRMTPKGCSVLSSVVSVLVLKCNKCGQIRQVSMTVNNTNKQSGSKEGLYIN